MPAIRRTCWRSSTIRRHRGRDTYVEDELFKRVYDKADPGLRDAMDLAYLTGQRVIDTRMMDEWDVRNRKGKKVMPTK